MADEENGKDLKRLEALIAQDAEHLRRFLTRVMKVAGLTQREVEQRLGLGTGYLSNVLNGRVELKHSHIAGILLVAGVEPSAFFELHYPKDVPFAPGLTSDDFVRRLERLGGVPATAPPEQDVEALPKTPLELKQFVLAILEAAGASPKGMSRPPATRSAARTAKQPRRTSHRRRPVARKPRTTPAEE